MRALVLGVNGFGNFAGVIGSQLYRPAYAPGYRVPFFATLGFIAVAFLGYISYRYTLAAVNVRKRNKIADMTLEDVEIERANNLRYSDKKWTFQYGL